MTTFTVKAKPHKQLAIVNVATHIINHKQGDKTKLKYTGAGINRKLLPKPKDVIVILFIMMLIKLLKAEEEISKLRMTTKKGIK